jgi:hypothetical protein
MTRCAGGGPATSRARRLASRAAVNFEDLRLLLAIIVAKPHRRILQSVAPSSSQQWRLLRLPPKNLHLLYRTHPIESCLNVYLFRLEGGVTIASTIGVKHF